MLREKIKEYLDYRELLVSLVIKELKVKYKNSILGFLWSFVNPLLLMIIYTFVFSIVFKNRGVSNFPVYLLVGLLPWNLLALSISGATQSIVNNASLVTKVYFPREFLPISIVIANAVNFLLELCVLFAFLVIFGYKFYLYLPVLVLAIILEVIIVAGFSLFFASTNVYFRDIQQLINILLLLWFFVTPIVYPIEMIPARFQFVLKVNPMASVILLYRSALYHTSWPSSLIVISAILSSIGVFAVGFFVFIKLSNSFAEEV